MSRPMVGLEVLLQLILHLPSGRRGIMQVLVGDIGGVGGAGGASESHQPGPLP